MSQSILTTCKANPLKFAGLLSLLGVGTVVVIKRPNIGSPMPFMKETWSTATAKAFKLYNSYIAPKSQKTDQLSLLDLKGELAKVKRENDNLTALYSAAQQNLVISREVEKDLTDTHQQLQNSLREQVNLARMTKKGATEQKKIIDDFEALLVIPEETQHK